MAGKLIIGLWLVLWHFAKAAWSGDVFPITAGGKIYDQGEPIGHLGGGRPQVIGRILAIPVLAVAGVGHRLGVLSAFVFMVLVAQILVWLGVWKPAGENFIYVVYVAAGVLGIATMIELAVIIYQRKVEGLRVLLPKMFGFKQQQPKQEQPQPQPPLVVVERTLLERLAAGFEDLAAGFGRFFGNKEEEKTGQE